MSLNNLVVNSSFETGSLSPWIGFNASITSAYAHTGFFSVLLQGDNINAYIYQFVPVTSGDRYELLTSIAKVGVGTAPAVTIQLLYYDASFNFLGYGIIESININSVPDVTINNTWLETYRNATAAPLGAT